MASCSPLVNLTGRGKQIGSVSVEKVCVFLDGICLLDRVWAIANFGHLENHLYPILSTGSS